MTGVPSDAELVLAAQAGQIASLGLVLERHRASMHAVALNCLGYSPEAEDAVQDAMLIALRRLSDLRDPSAVGPWLRAIVRNACRMRLRAPASRHQTLSSSYELSESGSANPSPEELLDGQAIRDWIWHALADLSEPLQVVVLLRYFSSFTRYDHMARLLGVPVGTVRSRLSQARQKLTERLLATAELAHDDATALSAGRTREVRDWLIAAEAGRFAAALAETWSPQVELIGPGGERGRGREMLVKIMESDLEAGVRQRLRRVTAGSRFTIIEAALLSPPWDPEHCPPGVVWLLTVGDQRVEKARLFHPQPLHTSISASRD